MAAMMSYSSIFAFLECASLQFAYRRQLESVCNFRLGVCERETDVEKIEAEIADGQIEELIDEVCRRAILCCAVYLTVFAGAISTKRSLKPWKFLKVSHCVILLFDLLIGGLTR